MLTKPIKFIELLYPAKCLCCYKLIAHNNSLCATCWNKLEFISNPLCHKCGNGFEYEQQNDNICVSCISDPPCYHSSRSTFKYNDIFSKIIAEFKYYDQIIYQQAFAKWLFFTGKDILPNAQMIISVPLHNKRLFKRRYNQSSLLAKELGRLTNIPTNFNILKRTEATPAQTSLPRNVRLKNVQNAFTIDKKYHHLIADKHIILIDDVITTGATINACSKLLLQNKAKRVDALTIARTPKYGT